MADLIDREKLLEKLEAACDGCDGFCGTCPYGYDIADVLNEPSVNPESLRPISHVKRGSVLETKDCAFCERCGAYLGKYDSAVVKSFAYCKTCGARMEENKE